LNNQYFSLKTQLIKLLSTFSRRESSVDTLSSGLSQEKFREELKGVEERILSLDRERDRLEQEERQVFMPYGGTMFSNQQKSYGSRDLQILRACVPKY
jgi:hypothetical protein